jgi:hypothetical protein
MKIIKMHGTCIKIKKIKSMFLAEITAHAECTHKASTE